MKIDFVIHSSNSNPMYLDFWPLVSKIWTVRFGIRPLLIYIDEDHSIPIDTTYGRVVKMKPVPGIPVYLQCLWVRYWFPSQFPDKVCMISDIDMFPISKSYFVDMIANISPEAYVHLYSLPDYLPSCYHVAKGYRFKEVLKLPESWEESIQFIYARQANPKDDYNSKIPFLQDKPQWGVDEEYATECVRDYPDRSFFVFVNRTHGRINREKWEWTEADAIADAYADSHSLRPYGDPEHRPKIDRLVNFLVQPRGLKQILHKYA